MSHRWVDHTAELELDIEAETELGVFEEALLALREVIAEETPEDRPRVAVAIVVAAPDRGALLAAWVDELVFRAETEGLVPERLEAVDLRGDELRASVISRPGCPRHVIKGATYHGLRFEPTGDGRYRATAVFDV